MSISPSVLKVDTTNNRVGINNTSPATALDVAGNIKDSNGYHSAYGWRNHVINGAFDVWQRGDTFSSPAANSYNADRWWVSYNNTGATRTTSRQSFGTSAISGAEADYFLRHSVSGGSGGTYELVGTKIENARTLAGKTCTLSFWAKASTAMTLNTLDIERYFNGSTTDYTTVASSTSITTSWQRFSFTFNMPTTNGKTIGANNFVHIRMIWNPNQTLAFDLWGMQLEAGSVATPFEHRPINIELPMCQRYYFPWATAGADWQMIATRYSTTGTVLNVTTPVAMRATPVVVRFGTGWGRIVGYDSSFNVTTAAASNVYMAGSSPNLHEHHIVVITDAMGGTYFRESFDTAGYSCNFGLEAEL
jgi:hypothetical protein